MSATKKRGALYRVDLENLGRVAEELERLVEVPDSIACSIADECFGSETLSAYQGDLLADAAIRMRDAKDLIERAMRAKRRR